MRLQHLQSSRPPWYDRNPQTRGYDIGYPAQPPHAAITLFSYTVPAVRKFMLETVSITAWRDTAAAPAGMTHNWLGIANDVNASIMPNNIWINNTVQFRLDFNVTMQAVMNSSNSFQGNSEDLSIGGTTTAYFSYKGTEFDAQ